MPLLYDTACYANPANTRSLFIPVWSRIHHKDIVTHITFKLVNFDTANHSVKIQLESFDFTDETAPTTPILRADLAAGYFTVNAQSVLDVTIAMKVVYYTVDPTSWKLGHTWSVRNFEFIFR